MTMNPCCEDCNRPYASGGFPDLVIPHDAWKQISTNGDDTGLLCPSCICQRLHDKGLTCKGVFMSGPIHSVSVREWTEWTKPKPAYPKEKGPGIAEASEYATREEPR